MIMIMKTVCFVLSASDGVMKMREVRWRNNVACNRITCTTVCMYVCMYICMYVYIYTGWLKKCPTRHNVISLKSIELLDQNFRFCT